MARPKRRRLSTSQPQKANTDWMPWPAFVGLSAGLLTAYLAAEVALYLRPHPLHWGVAALGAGVGYASGLLWARAYGR